MKNISFKLDFKVFFILLTSIILFNTVANCQGTGNTTNINNAQPTIFQTPVTNVMPSNNAARLRGKFVRDTASNWFYVDRTGRSAQLGGGSSGPSFVPTIFNASGNAFPNGLINTSGRTTFRSNINSIAALTLNGRRAGLFKSISNQDSIEIGFSGAVSRISSNRSLSIFTNTGDATLQSENVFLNGTTSSGLYIQPSIGEFALRNPTPLGRQIQTNLIESDIPFVCPSTSTCDISTLNYVPRRVVINTSNNLLLVKNPNDFPVYSKMAIDVPGNRELGIGTTDSEKFIENDTLKDDIQLPARTNPASYTLYRLRSTPTETVGFLTISENSGLNNKDINIFNSDGTTLGRRNYSLGATTTGLQLLGLSANNGSSILTLRPPVNSLTSTPFKIYSAGAVDSAQIGFVSDTVISIRSSKNLSLNGTVSSGLYIDPSIGEFVLKNPIPQGRQIQSNLIESDIPFLCPSGTICDLTSLDYVPRRVVMNSNTNSLILKTPDEFPLYSKMVIEVPGQTSLLINTPQDNKFIENDTIKNDIQLPIRENPTSYTIYRLRNSINPNLGFLTVLENSGINQDINIFNSDGSTIGPRNYFLGPTRTGLQLLGISASNGSSVLTLKPAENSLTSTPFKIYSFGTLDSMQIGFVSNTVSAIRSSEAIEILPEPNKPARVVTNTSITQLASSNTNGPVSVTLNTNSNVSKHISMSGITAFNVLFQPQDSIDYSANCPNTIYIEDDEVGGSNKVIVIPFNIPIAQTGSRLKIYKGRGVGTVRIRTDNNNVIRFYNAGDLVQNGYLREIVIQSDTINAVIELELNSANPQGILCWRFEGVKGYEKRAEYFGGQFLGLTNRQPHNVPYIIDVVNESDISQTVSFPNPNTFAVGKEFIIRRRNLSDFDLELECAVLNAFYLEGSDTQLSNITLSMPIYGEAYLLKVMLNTSNQRKYFVSKIY